ncbi:flagellar hook-basal body complex protein FliE [Listeria monocytogenes]|uniref:flagellar hook-basal body complex protein FliE n=1 Tax=Listeria monocytogenes TaxID=1639 RepID=UPI0010B64FCC|nr:flagellar hook-basal body complex protein FliE [Listeria monocytogenes]EAC4171887.1 flagellar hook-basal body complex protein FliE [Listeria monocytogenes]EAC4354272.1 flagellar hook-basal body complex protein FliE [Listeria monocytogenes]EAD0586143.1 flagellar hook-basal body complex protein FliE [Listeria monocytogenes]EAD2562173.1 flagellar hook-basal body complex protein FliE [Listeria monocytogenes]EAD5258166.1 flagellar hook-basal body complex protein FliE [Listeria monocytogenes]
MAIESINAASVLPKVTLGETAKTDNATGAGNTFTQMLDSMSDTQSNAQTSVSNLLTMGEGNASDVLIQMKKAESEMKTAAVIRDNVIESYKQLLNMQV